MLEAWLNNQGFKLKITYRKTNLTFREAAYETMKDIRARTNKNLVIPLSGGADSTIVYRVAKDLGIEFKTVHQRYWDGDRLINEYENKFVDPDTVDVYQDIDCSPQGEFRTSQWFKEMWEDWWPSPYWCGLYSWIKDILDPNNDFIIAGGHSGVKEWNYQDNLIWFNNVGTLMPVGQVGITKEGFESSGFLMDNPIILYAALDRSIMKTMSGNIKFEHPFKKTLFEHHFPEFDHLTKIEPSRWSWPGPPNKGGQRSSHPQMFDWFKDRSEYGEIRGYIPDHTEFNPIEKVDLFFDCIDKNVPISGEWEEWNWDLSDYGKEKLQYKIFTDKTEYFPSATPRSRLW